MYSIKDFKVVQDDITGKYWVSKDLKYALLRHAFEETYFVFEYKNSEWVQTLDCYDSIPQCMDKINGVTHDDDVEGKYPF